VAIPARAITPDYQRFRELWAPGRSVPVRAEMPADTETTVSAYLKLARDKRRAFLLESVEGGERIGRWSFVGADPRSILTWQLGDRGDPLAMIAQRLLERRGVPLEGMPPFAGGWVGFLAYDAVKLIEPRVPLSRADELDFPSVVFMDFDALVAFDNLRHTAHVIAEASGDATVTARQAWEEAVSRIERIVGRLRQPLQERTRPPSRSSLRLQPRVSRARFERAVARAREYICAGDCQQIVVSQRFDANTDARAIDLYRALRRVNPSPYLFLLEMEDRALIGGSPETLVKVRGGEVVVRPIAGTRRRGTDEEEDQRLETELRADPKENAEHVMLVDLGRNDVGRVARVGSVRIDALKTVERYSHVMHMVSQVSGRLAPGVSALDALRAAFPAGTVTGAPKVRAMEIIDELEPARRGPYAGCVGYIDRCGNLDMSIAIRMIAKHGRRVSIQAGAGIVHDSRPAAEYEETINKARAMKAALAQAGGDP
jgi:anthranilate synthase component 1